MEQRRLTFIKGKLSQSALFVLSNGAAITAPIQLDEPGFPLLTYRPGDEIDLPTEDERQPTLRCRILDIESIHSEAGMPVNVRLTLEKA